MTQDKIDDALESALNAILACQAIRKAAVFRPLDSIRQNDVLRKGEIYIEPRASDAVTKALDTLADAEQRLERLEAQRDLDAQHTLRKTLPREVE
jgi:hypothetical protein